MRCISSRATWWYKRIFPIVWFGFLIFFVIVNVFVIPGAALSWVPAVLVAAVMAVVGYSAIKRFILDLVDEAWDDGDALIVKNGNDSDRIALSDISNVGYSPLMNPPRVTLSLRKPSRFGDKVSFCAPIRVLSFSAHPVVEDLIRRVDAARHGHSRRR
jgi:hypothetical protein